MGSPVYDPSMEIRTLRPLFLIQMAMCWRLSVAGRRPNNHASRRRFATRLNSGLIRRGIIVMSRLMLFPNAVRREPAIEKWMLEHSGALGAIALYWFSIMRACGDDVRELLHDGHPTACIGEAAFCYVNVLTAHVNVGFFLGAELSDPNGLLEGAGKFMRHVKLRPEHEIDASALAKLIEMAYLDTKGRLGAA